jgi:hypothetical protein
VAARTRPGCSSGAAGGCSSGWWVLRPPALQPLARLGIHCWSPSGPRARASAEAF